MPKFNNAEEQAEFRRNQEVNERRIFARNAVRTLEKLKAWGYKDTATLSDMLIDLQQNPSPLSDRVGRGYSA